MTGRVVSAKGVSHGMDFAIDQNPLVAGSEPTRATWLRSGAIHDGLNGSDEFKGSGRSFQSVLLED
jgi:hypothetical protein